MKNTVDTAAIESIRSFAIGHAEVAVSSHSGTQLQLSAFVHMCTAAIAGEAWAVERFVDAFDGVHDVMPSARHPRDDAKVLRIILRTDCTRPDSAIARGIEV